MGRWISRRSALSLLLLVPLLAAAQGYPAKTVRIIVPAQPGGGLDLVGRIVADQLGRALGQPVIVENLSGGGGQIATQAVARAAPDGYTLMVGYVGTHGTNPAVRKLPYDAVRDFTPIAMVGGTPNVLVVQPSLPVASLRELIDHAKRHPGKVSYASGGMGTLNHLAMEQLKADAGFEAFVVHYRSIGPAINDFRSGQTMLMLPGLAAARPYIRSGAMRALAVTGTKRHPLLPEVPTFEQAGFRGFDGAQWYGIVGPAGLPAAITARLNAEINKMLGTPAVHRRLAGEAIDAMPMTPEAFGRYIEAEIKHWGTVARQRGIKVDDP
jgi:tripartite-type tricarboxylate transporter receptor subunit TctC